MITGASSSGSGAITIDDLNNYLSNPDEHIKEIRSASIYLTNKHGILKDALRMIKTLPTLKYSLSWSVEDEKDIAEYEGEVNNFLREIDVVKFIRDGLYEAGMLGTVAPTLRSNKYIQFLDLDEIVVRRQVDGRWVVEYDLAVLESLKEDELEFKLNSLPEEITESKLRQYLDDKKNEENRYVEIENARIVSIDALRNSPYGLPFHLGAWYAILHSELIDDVERSISERMMTQIILLMAGYFDKEGKKPVTDDVIDRYYKGIEEVLRVKEANLRDQSKPKSSTGLISLPSFLQLDSLKIDADMFERDLYEKLENDIYSNLGISRAMVFGEGGNYASARVNSEKLFSLVFSLVEQFEGVINDFLSILLPDNVICEIKFDKSTVLDKENEIAKKYNIYLQTSYATPWLEAALDMPIEDIIKQREYEIKNLKLEEIFYPAQNAHTTSGKEVGRPKKDDSDIDNDNTADSRTDDGNNTPSPSSNE